MKARSTNHLIAFDRPINVAAFVAALSRFLNSPEGKNCKGPESSIEVWSRISARDETVELYLSDAALAAARARFSPIPVEDIIPTQELPNDRRLILGRREIPSWGVDEAQRVLTSKTAA